MTESDGKVRPLVIVNRLFEWSQNFVTRELVELRRQGVPVSVAARRIVPREDLSREEEALAEDVILLPENPFTPANMWRAQGFKTRHPLRFLRAFTRLLTSGHVQPVKLGRSAVCLFRATTVARRVQRRDVNLIHAHFMTAPAETALYLSTLTGIPFGCTSHAMDIYLDDSGTGRMIARADYLVTENDANWRYMAERWPASAGKLIRIYNSLPLEPRQPEREPLGSRQPEREPRHHPLRFIAVGRLVPKKGFGDLIRACARLKERGLEFSCRIVGEGPLEDELRRLTSEAGVEDVVRFTGYVPPHDMGRVYAGGDVLVMPSVVLDSGDRDGLPTVCMEAMAQGLPLVCTDVAGLPECVEEGENGFVVPERDPEALAGAMAELIRRDELDGMRARSLEICREKFDVTRNVGRLRELMERNAAGSR